MIGDRIIHKPESETAGGYEKAKRIPFKKRNIIEFSTRNLGLAQVIASNFADWLIGKMMHLTVISPELLKTKLDEYKGIRRSPPVTASIVINNLVKLSNHLDQKGYAEEADRLDNIIKNILKAK